MINTETQAPEEAREYINFRVPPALKRKLELRYNKEHQAHLLNGGKSKEFRAHHFYIRILEGYLDSVGA